jgi:hypothetical protein
MLNRVTHVRDRDPVIRRRQEREVDDAPGVLSGLAGLEALMGNKDKGGRNTKKQAARSLKQKRAEKKAKRGAVKGKPKSGSF